MNKIPFGLLVGLVVLNSDTNFHTSFSMSCTKLSVKIISTNIVTIARQTLCVVGRSGSGSGCFLSTPGTSICLGVVSPEFLLFAFTLCANECKRQARDEGPRVFAWTSCDNSLCFIKGETLLG